MTLVPGFGLISNCVSQVQERVMAIPIFEPKWVFPKDPT
jgi:hypothetical protein